PGVGPGPADILSAASRAHDQHPHRPARPHARLRAPGVGRWPGLQLCDRCRGGSPTGAGADNQATRIVSSRAPGVVSWNSCAQRPFIQARQFPSGKESPVRKVLTAGAVALVLAASGPALAQEAQTEFSDQQLESFVVAAIAVDEVIREWNPRIQAAENEEQAAQLREEANA